MIHSFIHSFIYSSHTQAQSQMLFCPEGDCSLEGSGDPWNRLPHRHVEAPRNGQTQESEEVDQGAFVSQGASERWLEGWTSRKKSIPEKAQQWEKHWEYSVAVADWNDGFTWGGGGDKSWTGA